MTTLTPTSPAASGDAEGVRAAVLDAADRPLPEAMSLPAAAYTDSAYHQWEQEHVFKREWVALCHASQLPSVGDYMNVDLAGEPLVITRGNDEQLRVLSRVCRHRAMDICPKGFGRDERGNSRVLLCPYHFWGYGLDGQLKGCPEMQQAEGFNRRDVQLHEFRSELFGGFLFVNLSGDAEPLKEKLADLDEKFLSRWTLEDTEMVWEMDWPSDFDWKVLAENFMEAYHHMGSHAKTLEPMMPAKGCWTEPPEDHWSAVHLPIKDEILAANDGGRGLCQFTPFPKLDEDDYTQWWVFLGFPTFLLFVAPDRIYWYRPIPTGPGKCELRTTMLVHKSAKDAPDFEAMCKQESDMLIGVHTEDIEACVGVQRGVESGVWKPGRLSHLEEPVWHIQQYLARRIRAAATDA